MERLKFASIFSMSVEPHDLNIPSESSSSSSTCVPVHAGHSSQTEIKVEKVNHSWTVKNFSHCYQEYLENFVYLSRGDETLTWSIKIYPKGNGENNKDFVFLCLNRVVNSNAKSTKIGFKSRFMLRTAELKEIDMRIHPNPSHSDYVSYIKRDILFPQILPRDLIIVNVEIDVAVETITTTTEPIMMRIHPNPSHSDYVSYIKRDILFPQILPRDLIIVNVEIDVAVETITTTTEPIMTSNCEQQLVEDYQRLFRDDLLTDFTIRVGGREIRAHRAILAARSPVFQAMLMHELTNETKSGVLEISDLDYDVVYELVYYIYCGRCQKDIGDIATDLLIAADKYRLVELK
ncbi:BTB/POZ domain protein, partial [Ostertagia ostertagi]